jgi:hypothetical protein
LNSGIVKVPAIEPIFCCGSQKYGFFGFLRIILKRKNPDKFFSTQKKRLDKGNPTVQANCVAHQMRRIQRTECVSAEKTRPFPLKDSVYEKNKHGERCI